MPSRASGPGCTHFSRADHHHGPSGHAVARGGGPNVPLSPARVYRSLGFPRWLALSETARVFRNLFYWDGAGGKVLYGSDVHYQDMAAALADYRRLLAGAPLQVVDSVLGGTAAHIFGLTER